MLFAPQISRPVIGYVLVSKDPMSKGNLSPLRDESLKGMLGMNLVLHRLDCQLIQTMVLTSLGLEKKCRVGAGTAA
jgi:hypothetical protein